MEKNLDLSVIEFNAATARICRCVVRRSKRIITHCFSFPLAVSWGDLPQEIRSHLKTNKLAVSSAVLMLPRDSAASHLWTFPSNDPKEISQMARLRVLKECFGSDKESVLYDYKIVGSDREGCAQVVVFMMHRRQAQRYIEVLREAGIAVAGVTLNSAGLYNWLRSPQNSGVFLLNADDATFDFQFLVRGHSVFSRSFHITTAQEIRDRLPREIKLSLEMCRRQKDFCDGQATTDFCVTGALDRLLGVDIASLAGKEFRTFDPLEEAKPHLGLMASPGGIPVSYAAVLGLALSGSYEGVDLTPTELKKERELLAQKRAFKKIFLSCTAFLCLILSFYGFAVKRKIDCLAELRREVASLEKNENILNGLLLERYLDKEILKNGSIDDELRKLYETVPDGVSFASLDINDSGSVFLSGVAQRSELLVDFFKALKKEPAFQEARMDFSQQKGPQNGQSVKFRMSWTRR